jgi:hypothetical protein
LNARILVAIHREPTLRAGVDTIRERLFDGHTTSGAHLRCIPGVHRDHARASLFRFVLCDRDELVPGNIGNAFCQMMVLLHTLDLQVLKHNCTEPVNHHPGSLVSKIVAPIDDPFVDACDDLSGLLPFRSALLCLREFPLRLRKRLLVGAEEPWILDILSVREGGE